eukprot:scaffold21360_cov112-Isochrysis_galbana.AAC.3
MVDHHGEGAAAAHGSEGGRQRDTGEAVKDDPADRLRQERRVDPRIHQDGVAHKLKLVGVVEHIHLRCRGQRRTSKASSLAQEQAEGRWC